MNRKATLLVLVSVICSGMFIARSTPEYTTVSVVPLGLVCNHIAGVGDDFITVVTIAGNEWPYLYGFDFKVYFDPEILQCTGVEFPLVSKFLPIPPTPVINNDSGYVWLAAACPIGDCWEENYGKLAQIDFTVVGEGSSPLDLSEAYFYDCHIEDATVNIDDSFIDVGGQWSWFACGVQAGNITKVYSEMDPIGDLNGDGEVNIADLFEVARNYGQERGSP